MSETAPTTSYRQLSVSVPAADIRQAVYGGRQHVVVPVCALTGDKVIHSMNAERPEFVPAELLAQAPSGWNGRPVLPLHPADGSANTPAMLEAMSFGTVFNSRYDETDKKLKLEAWLDPLRADEVGELAQNVIARANRGEMVEVSIGAQVAIQPGDGELDGKPFSGSWAVLIPDHLAMLPVNVKGACSIEMGCGGPRLLSSHPSAKETDMSTPAPARGDSSFIQRATRVLSSLFGRRDASGPDGESDQDLRYKISTALHDTVAGFDWLREVYQTTSRVIYDVYREREYTTWSCNYSMTGDSVTLTDHTEVIAEVVYTPKSTPSTTDDVATTEERSACGCTKASPTPAEQGGVTPCACHRTNTITDEHAALSTQPAQVGGTMSTLATKVERLLGINPNADRRTLEALPEVALDAAIAAATSETETPAETAQVVAPAAPTPVVTATLSASQQALLAAAEVIVNKAQSGRLAFLAANTNIPVEKLRTKSEADLALLEEAIGGDPGDEDGANADFSAARVVAPRENSQRDPELLTNTWTRSLAAEAKASN